MKKIIFAMIIFSFLVVSSGIVLAEETSNIPTAASATSTKPIREKIANPNEIKLFEKIQKIGESLFGVRKQIENKKLENKNENNGKQDNEKVAITTKQSASSTKSAIEKISNPNEIKLFEKIQKIGTALWGIRKIENKIEITSMFFVKPVATECVKNAIDKKDTSTKTALTSHNQNIITALTNRTGCQKAALDKTTSKEQSAANKLCVETYQKSVKENNSILQKSKNDTWIIYKDDLKACSLLQKGGSATSTITASSEITDEIMINDGEEGNEIK